MGKFKSFISETDALIYLAVLLISASITIAECYWFNSLMDSIGDARQDNAAWLVIAALLICPTYCIVIPIYLALRYKKFKAP